MSYGPRFRRRAAASIPRRSTRCPISTQLRVGWWFGTERFADEGEFWRATITAASYR
jgi:hypothetical protein